MRAVLVSLVAILMVGLIAGCGGGSSSASSSDQAEKGLRLVESWYAEVATIAKASRAGDQTTVRRELPKAERFGRDARAAFVADDPSEISRAVMKAGDAWTLWAYTLTTDPPKGNFAKAQHIADLAATAQRYSLRALQTVGVDTSTLTSP